MSSGKTHDLTQTAFWKILQTVVKYLMIIGSVVSTACMVYAVIKRYVFRGNFYGSDEVIMLFAFWLYFMGAVYGSYEDSHIKADLLNVYVRNMRIKDAMALTAQLCTVIVNTIVLIWATRYFMSEISKWGLTTSLKIPMVIPKSAVFFGFLLMEFYHVYYLFRNARKYFREGFYTVPRPGDYVTAQVKAKFPNLDVPTKEEADAIRAAAKADKEDEQ